MNKNKHELLPNINYSSSSLLKALHSHKSGSPFSFTKSQSFQVFILITVSYLIISFIHSFLGLPLPLVLFIYPSNMFDINRLCLNK